MWTTAANDDTSSGLKRPFEESPSSGHESSSFCSKSYTPYDKKRWIAASTHPPKSAQLTLVGTKYDPLSSDRMDIAVADFIFSNALPISLVECTNFQHLIKCARFVPPAYLPPYRRKMTGNLLDGLYQSAYSKEIAALLKQSKIFGVALFGARLCIPAGFPGIPAGTPFLQIFLWNYVPAKQRNDSNTPYRPHSNLKTGVPFWPEPHFAS